MIIMKSINFENLITCLAESYHPDDSIPMNTTLLTRFADPMYFDGKEVIIITAEDEDMEDLETMIDDDDPVTEASATSLMYRIAKEEVRAVTKLFLGDLLEGDRSSGKSLVDFYNNREPNAFNDEVWDRAVHDVKTEMYKMLER